MLGTVLSFGETAVKEIQKTLCPYVCVGERDRERERQGGRERERREKTDMF